MILKQNLDALVPKDIRMISFALHSKLTKELSCFVPGYISSSSPALETLNTSHISIQERLQKGIENQGFNQMQKMLKITSSFLF